MNKGKHGRSKIIRLVSQILNNPDRPWDQQSLEWRIQLVRSLENALRSDFINTKDYKNKINDFLCDCDFRRKDINLRIKGARKKLKLTQKQLAKRLGYKSHVTIAQFEKGSRYPSKRVFRWLEEIGM
jgi:DNA-binding XRE family transcriptional regulator